MQKKDLLFLSILFYIGVVAIAIMLLAGDKRDGYKRGVSAVYDKAVVQAQSVYEQKKKIGFDFSSGPCLTNDLFTGWVVDIVHNPRIKADDDPSNQCPAFVEGRATHVVELDEEGNVVKVK